MSQKVSATPIHRTRENIVGATDMEPRVSEDIENWGMDIELDSGESAAPTSAHWIIESSKPHSKTAIGRLIQPVRSFPRLYIRDITVEVWNGKEWQAVGSRKLRLESVKEWLDPALEQMNCQRYIQILKDKGQARIILLVPAAKFKPAAEEIFNYTNDTEPKQTIYRKKDGSEKKREIRCKFSTSQSTDKYPTAFDFLLRGSEAQYPPNLFRALPTSGKIDHHFDPRLPEVLPTAAAFTIKPDYVLHCRGKPAIEGSLKESSLAINFDIVPCIPAKLLVHVVSDMVDKSQNDKFFTERIIELLPYIRRSLLGLKVRCTYKPAKHASEKATTLGQYEYENGRLFSIRDIKMSGDDQTTFSKGEKKDIEVYKYFAENVLPNGRKLDRNLPLVQDGSGAWIPLELLWVDGIQPFAHYGHLNEFILKKARTCMDSHYLPILKQVHDSVIDDALPRLRDGNDNFEMHGSTTFIKSALITKDPSLVRERCKKKDHITVEKRNVEIDTFYISAERCLPTKGDLPGKVLRGLASLGYEATDTMPLSKDDVIKSDDALSDCNAKLVFAIVDNESLNTDETQLVVRKLHWSADHKKGVLLVCATTSHLLKLYAQKRGAYFPTSLRHKINYMLGRTNFDISSLKKASKFGKGSLMIAGYHTAHHFDGKNYLPSVSTVVANTSASPSQFLGSSRVHTTTHFDENSDGRIIQSARAFEEELIEMMKERFEAYKAQPERLLFFHDSAAFDDKAHEAYCRALRSAYSSVYSKSLEPLQLTYIAVNKNTSSNFAQTVLGSANQATPTPSFVIDPEIVAKYRCYVIRNHNDLSIPELINMTRVINSSSQLASSTQPIATSLPTMLADKLCKRVQQHLRQSCAPREIVRTKKEVADTDAKDKHRIMGKKKLSKADMDNQRKTEESALKDAQTALNIRTNVEETHLRVNPWKEELNGTMFYL